MVLQLLYDTCKEHVPSYTRHMPVRNSVAVCAGVRLKGFPVFGF